MTSSSSGRGTREQDYDPQDQPKGWPHQPIQDIPEKERDALLKAGGPQGEAARVAWAQYQTLQERARDPLKPADATGPRAGAGMQEVPPPHPAGMSIEPSPGDVERAKDAIREGRQGPPASDREAKAVEEARDQLSYAAPADQQPQERKAQERLQDLPAGSSPSTTPPSTPPTLKASDVPKSSGKK